MVYAKSRVSKYTKSCDLQDLVLLSSTLLLLLLLLLLCYYSNYYYCCYYYVKCTFIITEIFIFIVLKNLICEIFIRYIQGVQRNMTVGE